MHVTVAKGYISNQYKFSRKSKYSKCGIPRHLATTCPRNNYKAKKQLEGVT